MGARNPIVFVLFTSLVFVMMVIYTYSSPGIKSTNPRTKNFARSQNKQHLKISTNESVPKSCYKCNRFKCKLLEDNNLKELHCRQRLPQLFNIGAKKSGTTTLRKFMDLHPSLAGISFRLESWDEDKHIHDIADLITKEMYYTTPKQITFQNNPDFFSFDMRTLKRLAPLLNDNVPLIMLFRDPVHRALSDYVHVKEMIGLRPDLVHTEWRKTTMTTNNDEKKEKVQFYKTYEIRDTFESTVLDENGDVRSDNQLIDTGVYVKHVTSYLDTFKLKQMLFLDGELFKKDPLPILREVENFLKIPGFYQAKHFQYVKEKGFHCAFVEDRPDVNCMDFTKGRQHPQVNGAVLDKLTSFYRPYTIQLQNIIGKTFSWVDS